MSATMDLYERIVEGDCPMRLLRDACLEQEVDFLEAKTLALGGDYEALKDLLGMI